MENINNVLAAWLKFSDDKTRKSIESMDESERLEAFSSSLEFGTAGLRGKMGIGPNRINKITIAKAAYGYGRYIIEKYGENSSLVIGTDNRHQHKELSNKVANIFSSMGIKVFIKYIFPTPMVSFAIRELKAQGGVIITASHNPPEYNGFKVYDNFGGQLLPQETEKILNFSKEIKEFLTYKYEKNESLISPLPSHIEKTYQRSILSLDQKSSKDLKIVFSPQHGASADYLPNYLEQLGYQVIRVEEQMNHDPYFSNTISPNPEDDRAYILAKEYAKKFNADIIIITDPDADRIGVAALKDGDYQIIDGNEFSTIIFESLINSQINYKNSYMVYSYVSSKLPALIAEKHGIETIPVATGFKWVAEMIKKYSNKKFIFGFEESFGCLIKSNLARDKDSIQAAILIAKIAQELKQSNKTLLNKLELIYEKYGFFKGDTILKEFKGYDSNEQRSLFMNKLRNLKLDTEIKYKTLDLRDGYQEIVPMNMLRFEFENGSWISVRPSGTEPKIKFYLMAGPQKKNELECEYNRLNKIIRKLVN